MSLNKEGTCRLWLYYNHTTERQMNHDVINILLTKPKSLNIVETNKLVLPFVLPRGLYNI